MKSLQRDFFILMFCQIDFFVSLNLLLRYYVTFAFRERKLIDRIFLLLSFVSMLTNDYKFRRACKRLKGRGSYAVLHPTPG